MNLVEIGTPLVKLKLRRYLIYNKNEEQITEYQFQHLNCNKESLDSIIPD